MGDRLVEFVSRPAVQWEAAIMLVVGVLAWAFWSADRVTGKGHRRRRGRGW